MPRTQTAAQRLAEALCLSSVLVNTIIGDDAGLATLEAALEQLTGAHGAATVNRTAALVEAACDHLRAEILIKPRH